MINLVDKIISGVALVVMFPVILGVTVVVFVIHGSPIFKQQRIGRDGKKFYLYKFRTMPVDTPSCPTHQLAKVQMDKVSLTLRRFKLDELPQLVNVLRGEMSLVGPRPCLPSQIDLIEARTNKRLLRYQPGITGLAQIQGVDMSEPELLAEIDAKMMTELTLASYFRYLVLTLLGRGRGDRLDSHAR